MHVLMLVGNKVTCPVHGLAKLLDETLEGAVFFENISAAEALRVLREMLAEIGVENAGVYRTHDIRRGHALDLQESGTTAVTNSSCAHDQCSCCGVVVYRRATVSHFGSGRVVIASVLGLHEHQSAGSGLGAASAFG